MKTDDKIAGILVQSLMILMVSSVTIWAQQEFPMEEIFLRTERDLYLAGEEVHFKLYTLDATSGKPVHFSDMVYLELLDRQHSPLVQKKFAISGGESSGRVVIPFDLVSEHYYVRAYTSWMKNAGATRFAYQLITVINPFEEISPETIATEPAEESDAAMMPREQVDGPMEQLGVEISVRTDHVSYGTRQKVVLEIDARDRMGNPVEASLFLSVARKGLLNAMDQPSPMVAEQPASITEVFFPPEWGGHFIQGNISHRSDGEPIVGDTLVYSVVGKKSIIDYSISDEMGNFKFLAKCLNGLHEIVIQNLNSSKADYQIMLEDPFSADYPELQLPAFYIDTSNLSEINQAVIAAQVNALYAQDRIAEDRIDENQLLGSLSFYGIPEQEVILADYIRLPEMNEVFFELIPDAQMRERGEQTTLRVRDTKYGPYFNFTPLMLVDGVATPDPAHLAALDALKVERIDVVTSTYHYGVLEFPGIVSIFTQDGRCPVIFPRYYFRQSYDFVSSGVPVDFPVYPKSSGQEGPMPDFRNTLYWDPDITTDEEGRATVEFYTSDDVSDYILMIQGYTPEGLGGSFYDTISVTTR